MWYSMYEDKHTNIESTYYPHGNKGCWSDHDFFKCKILLSLNEYILWQFLFKFSLAVLFYKLNIQLWFSHSLCIVFIIQFWKSHSWEVPSHQLEPPFNTETKIKSYSAKFSIYQPSYNITFPRISCGLIFQQDKLRSTSRISSHISEESAYFAFSKCPHLIFVSKKKKKKKKKPHCSSTQKSKSPYL